MKITSKTGLTAIPTRKKKDNEQVQTVQLKAISRPAPFVLKPFAGLYNPYPYGCSLLCNHPTDKEAKELLKKAKDNWALDTRNVLLAEEIDAIRVGLQNINSNGHPSPKKMCIPQVESVPEELFRRYTETDSRPLTPAPTLASGATRASGLRRCVTPDPLPTNQIREKTLLILDLRRSHSQETLSYYGSSSVQEPPLIRIQRVASRAASLDDIKTLPQNSSKSLTTPVVSRRPKSSAKKTENGDESQTDDKSDIDSDEEDGEFIKRRGKRRKKRGRDASRGPPAFQASLDPETQVATIGIDSHNPSARPSLIPDSYGAEIEETVQKKKNSIVPRKSLDIDSYLDRNILKQLRRELNEEIVDNELNLKRRKALEEALKTITKGKPRCDELVALQKELRVPPINTELWISLPRTFSRASASFELPMDSRTLSTMTPLEYVRDNVNITSARKLLYNCIFNKFKLEADEDNGGGRNVAGSVLPDCLNLVMGRALSDNQLNYIRSLIGWNDNDIYDFKMCCGIFALCERLLAPEFCQQLPDRKTDPCQEIETADFEALSRKLLGKTVNEKLYDILMALKTV